jgi:hypothetical protein
MDLKKKKTSPPYLSAQQPTGPLNFSPAAARLPFFFFLFFESLTTGSHLSVPPSPFFLPFPSSTPPGRAPPQPGRACFASPAPPSFLYLCFMAINHRAPLLPRLPYRYSAPLLVMAAGHLWQGRPLPHPSTSPSPSMWLYKDWAPLSLPPFHPTRPFSCATASLTPVSHPLISLSSSLVIHTALTELTVP